MVEMSLCRKSPSPICATVGSFARYFRMAETDSSLDFSAFSTRLSIWVSAFESASSAALRLVASSMACTPASWAAWTWA